MKNEKKDLEEDGLNINDPEKNFWYMIYKNSFDTFDALYNEWDKYFFEKYGCSWEEYYSNEQCTNRKKKEEEDAKKKKIEVEELKKIQEEAKKREGIDPELYKQVEDILNNNTYDKNTYEKFEYIHYYNSGKKFFETNEKKYLIADNRNIEDMIIGQLEEYKKNKEKKVIIFCLNKKIEEKIINHVDFNNLNDSLKIYFYAENNPELYAKNHEYHETFLCRIIKSIEKVNLINNSYLNNVKIFTELEYSNEITFYVNKYLEIHCPDILVGKIPL
jgi:hypothetical protein